MKRTIRQQIIERLEGTEMGAKDISGTLGIREKEVYDHLSHIRHSLKPMGKKLVVRPSECMGCWYVFKDRHRLTAPGRCPRCRKTYVSDPGFKIDSLFKL